MASRTLDASHRNALKPLIAKLQLMDADGTLTGGQRSVILTASQWRVILYSFEAVVPS